MNAFLTAYRTELIDAMNSIDPAEFQKFIDILLDVYRQRPQVFIAGRRTGHLQLLCLRLWQRTR